MTPRPLRATLMAAAAAIVLAVAAPAAQAMIVFDPTNYAQNVLQAARALQQINNQIAALENQAQMLVNQTRNLISLPYSSLAQLQMQVARTQQLLAQAQHIAYDVGQIQTAYKTNYGAVSLSASDQTLVARADARWATSVGAFEDALKVQAGVVTGMAVGHTQMQALVSASQTSTGALQAAQAGNQLLALQAQQLTDLTALIAAEGRAQALESADRAAARSDAQARMQSFMAGQTYQAAPVQMFHP